MIPVGELSKQTGCGGVAKAILIWQIRVDFPFIIFHLSFFIEIVGRGNSPSK
jgi:hypothetical protein